MADISTPSAMAIDMMNAGAETKAADNKNSASTTKPEKPDEAAFKSAEEAKEKELKLAQAKSKEADEKFNASKPSNKDSPTAQRSTQLKTELAEIRTKQQANKNAKSGVQDRISALDVQLKTKFNEQKTVKARLPFKNVEEIDQRIAGLTKEVESGRMRIVDEKKNLSEISSLNKQKKEFSGLDNIQKSIDSIKQSISETKKELENPEMKALSAEYDKKQAELNTLKGEQDQVYKSRDANREALSAAKGNVARLYGELKALRDEYYGARRAFVAYERESKQQYFAKKKAENEARDLEKKKRYMEEDLEAARSPAYLDEIHACDQLIRILDPGAAPSKTSTTTSKFAATAQRTIDAGEVKGMKLSKKDDEEAYFVGSGGKKKKGKKSQQDGVSTPSKAVDVGVFFTPGVAEHFDKIGVRQPSSADDQARALDEIRTKRKHYEDTQDEKTKENIAAVQKKFDRLEAASANMPQQTNGTSSKDAVTTNGTSQEDKTVTEGSTDSTAGISQSFKSIDVKESDAE